MLRVILLVALLASPALSTASPAKPNTGAGAGAERRRAFYRRSTTTAAPPVPAATHEDTASAESNNGGGNIGIGGEGLYTVGDSFTIGGGGGLGGGGGSSSSSAGDSVGKGSAFKPVTSGGDKLTSFSEYNFGGTKLSDPADSDEDYGLGSLKNHKPLTSSNSFKTSGTFDFLNNDFSKTSLDLPLTRPKSSITSKFSISHPTPSKSSGIAGKLDHLDDSTEYDVYSSLKSSSSYRSPLQGYGTSQFSAFPGSSSLNFDGKVKKVPFTSFDDSGLTGSLTTSGTKYKKNKLSLDDDTFGGGVGSAFGGLGNSFGVGKLEDFLGGGAGFGKKNPFRYVAGEPPLVKSALSTLTNFGHGILGKPEKASSLFDDSGESGTGGFGASKFKPSSTFGKQGSFSNSFNLDDSNESYEPAYAAKPKHPKPHSSFSSSSSSLGSSSSSFGSSKPLLKPSITEFDSDFDVKNIKLPGAHSITNSNSNKFRPHNTKSTLHKSKLHGSPNIDNPNPLEFRPNFKLQDVPNLYPDDHHLGAGIAAKGQIENFLNQEGAFKPKPFRTTHYLDGAPPKQNPYAEFAKPTEDDNLEKEALKAQIEFLKAQAAKRSPAEVRQRPPHGGVPLGPPAKPGHGPIRGGGPGGPRPVRRIPALGVKSSHPLPRIPHYNDRPYSISFKL